MNALVPATPPLLIDFLLTLGMSFLLGLGLREYYLASQKTLVFGTTRTCTFIGLLGFALFQLQPGGWLYLAGLLVLGALLSLYYHSKLNRQYTGMIGILIALLSYAVGPVTQTLPDWFLILFTITVLFVLNAKEKIYQLTQRLANEEIVTLAKFLVLSGVILPLTPREPIASFIPVSVHQTWLAVVVISAISYSGYLAQTYFFHGRGILLTGAIGGIYSSTATTVVAARRSHQYPERSTDPAAAIVLATGVMYVRLLPMVAIFNISVCLSLLPGFLGLAAVAGIAAFFLHRGHPPVRDLPHSDYPQNPLELNSALLFALLFVLIAAATHFILGHYAHQGLQWMAFFAGLASIDPFVLLLLEGDFPTAQPAIVQAIITATASNNLLKAAYTLALGERHTGRVAGAALAILAGLTLAYGVFAH